MSTISPYGISAMVASGSSIGGGGGNGSGSLQRKVVCRYGSGCTHILDPTHKEKFWHPAAPKLNNEQLKGQFICNECGYFTTSLHDLQMHLKRKTAWSNQSLVGCRINCLVDYKEWHEGHVTQFHKSGKHFVEFRVVNEKRWLVMKKIAFYIVERPPQASSNTTAAATAATSDAAAAAATAAADAGAAASSRASSDADKTTTTAAAAVDGQVETAAADASDWSVGGGGSGGGGGGRSDEKGRTFNSNGSSEFKDNSPESDNLAPIEDCWVFYEDISLEYAFAQSVLFKIYGNSIQETGHLTKGHVCLTESDRINAQFVKGSLLYGELLPRGANKAFGSKRLEASRATVLFDLGMGTGKIVVQAFLQFKNLRYIFGIELSSGRYKIAEEAVLRMVRLLGADNYNVQINPGHFIIVTEAVRKSKPAGDLECDEKSVGDYGIDADQCEYEERVLHLQCGNMFDVKNIRAADVVMMETDIPMDVFPSLHRLLGDCKDGCRILSYLDLRRVWEVCACAGQAPFKQLEANRHLSDRYPTSWSVQRGHHFYLWTKISAVEQASTGGVLTSGGGWGLGFGGLVSSSNSQLRTGNENGQLQVQYQLVAAAQKPAQLDRNGSGRGGTSGRQSSNNRSAADTTTGAEGATYEAIDPLAAAQQLNVCNKSRGASASQSDKASAAEEQQVSRCVPLRRFGFFFRSSHGSSSGGSSNKPSSSANTTASAAGNNLTSSTPADATPPAAAKSSNSGSASSSRGSRKNRRNRGSNGDADGNSSNERVVIPINADGTRTAAHDNSPRKQQTQAGASNENDFDVNDGAFVLYPRGTAADNQFSNPVAAASKSERGSPRRDSNISEVSAASGAIPYPNISKSAHSSSSMIHVGNDGETITGSVGSNARSSHCGDSAVPSGATAALTHETSDYLYMSDVRARLRTSSPGTAASAERDLSTDRSHPSPSASAPDSRDNSPRLQLGRAQEVDAAISVESMHEAAHRSSDERQQQQQQHQHEQQHEQQQQSRQRGDSSTKTRHGSSGSKKQRGRATSSDAAAAITPSPRSIEAIVHSTGVQQSGVSSMMMSDLAASKRDQDTIEASALKMSLSLSTPMAARGDALPSSGSSSPSPVAKVIDRSTTNCATAVAAELMNSSVSAAAAAAAACRDSAQGKTGSGVNGILGPTSSDIDAGRGVMHQALLHDRNYQLDASRDPSPHSGGKRAILNSEHDYYSTNRNAKHGSKVGGHGSSDGGCTIA